jgi:hypothetical protein
MVWEPRIQRIQNAWTVMERLAVVEGIKPAALQICPPHAMVDLTRWAVDNKLICIPLRQQGISDGYANGTRAYEPGRSWAYRVIVGKSEVAASFATMWDTGEDSAIGAALGFPGCCCNFFQKYWVEEAWRDLTYPMVGTHGFKHTVSGPMECNILLRWLGLRLVSHLPCSFHCSATEAIGQEMGLLGIRANYVQEMDWLAQILSWPIRWSSLHGVAIITTPVFRLVVDSDALKEEVIIDRDGPVYPIEAAQGNDFPFKDITPVILVRDEHTDNGFASKDGMTEAHERIILKLLSLNLNPKSVLDLGCGNGLLLQKIGKCYPKAKLHGIEIEEKKHQKAARRLLSDVRLGNIMDFSLWDQNYDVILVAEQRLEEDVDMTLLPQLMTRGKKVITYNYTTGTVRV